ncbi:hypothetical protein H4R33_006510 [Dimargaris cristalligena]|uniref:Uncharacterized protein n=1 Tax=Dimargaris cristalligena TaxID=215637 RepID=A0A4P9ZL60_9FUNG|nr:hypothetical protein H4R33_006510 [Dimargaris cristalligena]RKP33818.1 hypothetical protein BJ085DRAFT_32291 [Dimargaris cristalligena]|eukprot:RKP33818.1 hypothetical protein BJ085DRAFT_32291 [Dimargaris cristalligena]
MISCFMPRRKKSDAASLRRNSTNSPSTTLPSRFPSSSLPTVREDGPYMTQSSSTTLTSPPKLVSAAHPQGQHNMLMGAEEGYSSSLFQPFPLLRTTSSPLLPPRDSSHIVRKPSPSSPLVSPLHRFDAINASQTSLNDACTQDTVIPALHTKHSAWSLADYKLGTDNYIQPPKRSWRSSYEVW